MNINYLEEQKPVQMNINYLEEEKPVQMNIFLVYQQKARLNILRGQTFPSGNIGVTN